MSFVINSFDDIHKAYGMARDCFQRRPWFRGQADGSWALVPKVFRNAPEGRAAYQREASMISKFKARARIRRIDCPSDNDCFGWLALMQHFSAPTRLLDWTESILVAAFFAASDNTHKRGSPSAIWAMDPYRMNALADGSSCTSVYGYPVSPDQKCVSVVTKEVFSGNPANYAPLAVIPPQNDLRMLVQHATFTMSGSREALDSYEWEHRVFRKYTIDDSFRDELVEMLATFGINRASLFPDLGSLASDIAETEPNPASWEEVSGF